MFTAEQHGGVGQVDCHRDSAKELTQLQPTQNRYKIWSMTLLIYGLPEDHPSNGCPPVRREPENDNDQEIDGGKLPDKIPVVRRPCPAMEGYFHSKDGDEDEHIYVHSPPPLVRLKTSYYEKVKKN